MQKKTLIAMAVLAASCSAMAASQTENGWSNGNGSGIYKVVEDNSTITEKVSTLPTATDATGFIEIGQDVSKVTFKEVELKKAGAASNGKYYGAYIKNYGQDVRIDTLSVTGGTGTTTETIGMATLEFWPNIVDGKYADDTRAKSFDIGSLQLNENSVLRVTESSYFGGGQNTLGKVKGTTTFRAENVAMSNHSAIAFGVGSTQIDQAFIGEVTAAGAITGIAANSDAFQVGIGTINIEENAQFDLTGTSFPVDIKVGNSSIRPAGVTLVGLSAEEAAKLGQTAGTVTANLNGANAKLILGNVGVAPTEAGTASLLADAADAGTPTKLVINFSEEALTSEGSSVTFGEDAVIAKGSTMEATTEGAVTEKTVEETAQLLAKKAYGDKSVQNAVTASEGPAKVTVSAKGIEDGFTGEVDLTNLPTGDEGFKFENVARTENETTHSIAQLSAVGYMQWRSAMNHLQYRMGELRDHSGYNNGGWIRFYGGEDKYGSQDVKNQYYGFQSGYDHRIEGTNVIVGGAVSYTKGDSDFTFGEGDNYNYDFTAYGTWLADSGLFVDGTIKYGRLSNDLTVDDRSAFGASSADYDTNAMSVSLETGWRFPVMQNAYVEPQAEIMYGHVWAADYSFGQYDVTNEALDTTVGRLGVQAGLQCPSKKGSAYVRASVLHDFQGDADTTFRDGLKSETITQELGDTWYELGLGAQWNVTDATYLYADVQYADGGEVESPWRASVGMRFAW